MSEKHYTLGTDQHQAWMKEYFFAPRGGGFFEPGIVTTDSVEFSTYNVAKSFYQNYPEVFNIKYVEKKTGLKADDIKKRLKRMYDERLIMLVYNPAVQAFGWGLYWWVVKLKEGTTPEFKERLASWYQDKDDICTGSAMCNGDFDFMNGNHMRVLDNLLSDVIGPWKDLPEVQYVHTCPVRRVVRECNISMFDSKEHYRKFWWSEEAKQKFFKAQKLMDKDDFAIYEAINSADSVADMFDYDVLAKLSGLDAKKMKEDFKLICENRRLVVPLLYLNAMKLGLTTKFVLVRLFQMTPSYVKALIGDAFDNMEELVSINEFSDSFYDFQLTFYDELEDWDKIREKIEGMAEVEEIWTANSDRNFRRWTCRLDDENGFWEEGVFTDDFLQDRTANECLKCNFSGHKEV